jgi:hypothetical protein
MPRLRARTSINAVNGEHTGVERARGRITHERVPCSIGYATVVPMATATPLPLPALSDVQRARALGLDVVRMRALGLSEDSIAEAERLRRLGFDDADEAGKIVVHTPEELEAALEAIACAPST